MSAHDVFAQMFDVGRDILVTYLNAATNVILAQTGDSTGSVPDADAAEWWQHTGFWSRPALPTQGGSSCQGLIIKRGDRDVIYASRDTRNSSIYGKLGDGETCVGASTGQARTIYKSDGSIHHVTTVGNTPGGTTFIVNQSSDGSFTIQAPAALFQIDATGKITLGNTKCGLTMDPATGKVLIFGTIVQAQASGVAMVSGDVATVVGPKATVTPANAAAYSVVGPANVVSTNVFISV
jgi:hypothetical protein